MAGIRHYLSINAPAAKVYRAITEQDGLASWWTEDCVVRPEEGSISEFNFGDRYHNKMKVTRLVANQRVQWECLEGDAEWVGTRFVFELEEEDGKTVVRFGHTHWREATDFMASCNYHWGCYMTSLKSYCETGRGSPFPKSG